MITRPLSVLVPYGPLLWRLSLAAALVIAELVLRSAIRATDPLGMEAGMDLRLLYSLVVAWPATLTILAVAGGSPKTQEAAGGFSGAPLHYGWLIAHFVAILPVVWPQLLDQFATSPTAEGFFLFLPHALAPVAVAALLCGLAPAEAWMRLVRSTGNLPLRALLIASAAVLMIQVSRLLWEPAAAVTFALVKAQLLPFFPDLQVLPAERILATNSLKVLIAEACSGLEGIGLILVFCTGWLWHMRREFLFPRALLILPVAVVVVFLLNSVRISLLFAIAEIGFVEIATAGFHSQAGWIFFLAVAFLIAVVTRQMAWLQKPGAVTRSEERAEDPRQNPVAPLVLPLLAILATGMLVSAFSAGFEYFYSLRLVVCVIVLLIYRRSYTSLDWRFGWRAIAGGLLVFCVWFGAAHWLVEPAGMPAALAEMSPAARGLWIATRFAATAITVPVAEELAFRAFLMRRIASADFASIGLKDVTIVALLLSSVLFGLTHGSFWAPGILAGLVYGALAKHTGRIGEAVVAHATTNGLLAAAALWFDQWQLT